MIMVTASLMDTCTGKELALISSRIQGWVGLAVVLMPWFEVQILRLGKNEPAFTYKVLGVLGFLHLIYNFFALPETLEPEKRSGFAKFRESASSINPLAFLKIYTGKNRTWKQLVSIQTLQCVAEA